MIVRNAAGKAVFSDRKMGKADLVSGARLFCGLNSFLPGQCHALHSHVGQDKLYLVLEGQGLNHCRQRHGACKCRRCHFLLKKACRMPSITKALETWCS